VNPEIISTAEIQKLSEEDYGILSPDFDSPAREVKCYQSKRYNYSSQ